MLELKNICVSFRSERQDKVFGHTRQQVLFDVSLNVKRGTCLGILGESGSGKSTMGRVLCGLLKPDSGEAILDGVSVYASRAGRRNLQNKLSVVFQDYTTSANPRFRSWWDFLLILRTDFPTNSPVASFSGCASPGRWPVSQRSSSLMRRSPPWMRIPRSR